jgi:hypothetical protein
MDFAIYIVKYFAAPATVIAAIAWLAKESVLQSIKTQSMLVVEKSRQEMQQNLEKLRYQLTRDVEDFKTRFSQLQEKRFEPILKFYSSIAELCSHASHIHVNLTYFPDEKIDAHYSETLEDLISKAKEDYFRVRLFLPESIAHNSKNLIDMIASSEMDYYVELKGGSGDWTKAQKKLQRKLAINYDDELGKLSREIRFLLGVENSENLRKRNDL